MHGGAPPPSPRTSGSPPSAGQDVALRAVIWHAATGELPGELLSSLTRRIGKLSICTDGCGALAEACLIERARRMQVQANIERPTGGVLVLVHPQHLVELGAVIEAVRTYAPSVALWQYDRSANPKLRAIVEEDVRRLTQPAPAAVQARPEQINGTAASKSQAPQIVTRPVGPVVPRPVTPQAPVRPPEPPRMRLVGTEADEAPPAAPSTQSNGTPSNTPRPAVQARRSMTQLTEDELRMLLSDEPIDAAQRGRKSTDQDRGPSGGGTR